MICHKPVVELPSPNGRESKFHIEILVSNFSVFLINWSIDYAYL